MSASATTELQVRGMTCNNCARHVTEALQGVPNVRSAMVSLAQQRATVRWVSASGKSVAAALAAVAQAGYQAVEMNPAEADAGPPARRRWQWNLILGLSVTAGLMAGEWVFQLDAASWFAWVAFVLAGVVQVFCGAQFYAGAWRQLKAGQSNMDTLVALGSTTAFGYSAWALFAGAGGHLYFMEAAAIISLISFGHWLEARVSEKTGGALKSLLQLAPPTARRLSRAGGPGDDSTFKPQSAAAGFSPARPRGGGASMPALARPAGDGATQRPMDLKTLAFSEAPARRRAAPIETEVPVSELRNGDLVALRPGDHVPVDGVVLEGESAVDEAMLTGESAPVDKKSGSELFAGTVNLNGRLVMRVTATGEATALAHIVAAVQRAQTSRAEIQRLGDRISSVFVPVIVTLALAAGLWWGLAPSSAARVHEWLAQFLWQVRAPAGTAAGFIIAAAVLIIACPCAMGLATPAAIMAAANTAARRGILIRDGVALEKAGGITAVVFDKTGTLTVGRPEIAAVWPSGAGEGPALELARALAAHSTHPLSQAVAAYCGKLPASRAPARLSLGDWREIRGCGVEAQWAPGASPAVAVRLGSLLWLRQAGAAAAAAQPFVDEWSAQGATLVGLAVDGELAALFVARDAIKPHAAGVVAQLQAQNLRAYLVTGDRAPTAAAIARSVGLAPGDVFAEVRPEQKADFVKQLQARGGRVAFVGDGLNDAPALTQADLGVAVSRASDLAREAADIILLKSEIEAVPEALGLARATLRTIRQNLFWAFFYNALGVPLAALGFVSPVFCAAAMGVSDLVVIGNALRLLRWRAPAAGRPAGGARHFQPSK